MKVLRLYTEDKNVEAITALMDMAFKSYSICRMEGRWQGKQEQSLCFEIITDEHKDYDALEDIARAIKAMNKQEAILIMHHPITAILI